MIFPILRLSSLDLSSADRAGVKASRLGFLMANGFAVPHGYCILRSAYEEHLSRAAIRVRRRDCLVLDGPAQKILDTPIDVRLGAELRRISVRFGAPGTAVRSSSSAEDLSSKSFAGVYESILGVKPDDCASAVLRVWASFWDEPATAARRAACIDDYSAGMAVIIQRMVRPRFAGVVFTVDPREGREDRMAVEIVAGQGDSLVDGTEQGKRLEISREGLALTGGESPIPHRVLKGLASTALKIEELFGAPQDIEWCLDDDLRLWVLQARPITGEVFERLLFKQGWERAYDDPFSPFGRQLAIRRHARWVEAVNARYRTRFRPEVRELNGLLYVRAGWRRAGRLTRWRMGLTKVATWCRFNRVRDEYSKCRLRLDHFLKGCENANLGRFTDRRLFYEFRCATQRYLNLQVESYPMVELAKVACSLLERFCRHRLPAGLGVSALLTGLDNPTVAHDMRLAELAGLLRDSIGPDELRQLESAPLDALDETVREAIGEPAENLLRRHGYLWADRYPRDPAWKLSRSAFLRALAAEAIRPDGGLADFHRKQTAERLANVDKARELLKSSPILSRIFETLLARAAEAFPAKEERNEQVYLSVMAIRRLGLEIGARLCGTRFLDAPEDVFLMDEEEIRDAFLKRRWASRLRQQISARKSEDMRLRAKLRVPTGAEPVTSLPSSGSELVGDACSPGVASGPARLVGSFDQLERVRTGDILVCRQLRPAWSTVLSRAAAVVVEKGALLSHGATLAREYGIPAVMNVTGLFQAIAEGAPLHVDGNQGVITIRRATTESETPAARAGSTGDQPREEGLTSA